VWEVPGFAWSFLALCLVLLSTLVAAAGAEQRAPQYTNLQFKHTPQKTTEFAISYFAGRLAHSCLMKKPKLIAKEQVKCSFKYGLSKSTFPIAGQMSSFKIN
jgi:hypothetical protein